MHYVEATQTKVGFANAVVTERCYFDGLIIFKYRNVILATSLTGFPYLPSRSLLSLNLMT